jgi:hypothetical protein
MNINLFVFNDFKIGELKRFIKFNSRFFLRIQVSYFFKKLAILLKLSKKYNGNSKEEEEFFLEKQIQRKEFYFHFQMSIQKKKINLRCFCVSGANQIENTPQNFLIFIFEFG